MTLSKLVVHNGRVALTFAFSLQKTMLDLLEGWLRHKSDMVNFEAARAICEMRTVDPSRLSRAISGEFMLLSCPSSN